MGGTQSFDTVKVYFPNKTKCKVDWYISGKPKQCPITDLFYVEISVKNSMFFNETTGETSIATGLSTLGENIKNPKIVHPRLVILSDTNNKKILRKKGFNIPCKSTKTTLSDECGICSIAEEIAEKLVDEYPDFHGVAFQKDGCSGKNILCQNTVFLFKEGILKPATNTYAGRCGIIDYSKKHNTRIRQKIRGFPTIKSIDASLKKEDCGVVSKKLYSQLKTHGFV